MKKILSAILIGMFGGGIAGALILGVDQGLRERWQVDSAEIERWVSIAVFMGAFMGAVAGALIGLVVGFERSRRIPN